MLDRVVVVASNALVDDASVDETINSDESPARIQIMIGIGSCVYQRSFRKSTNRRSSKHAQPEPHNVSGNC